jgi:hypothetical protein
MQKIECTVKDIPQEIMWSDLFEFRLKTGDIRFTECVNNVAFGNNKNTIYISFIDWGDDYHIIEHIKQENFNDGIEIALADRCGSVVALFEFNDCIIKDIASIILDYCGNYKTPKNRYIASIEYNKVYKIKPDEE